MGKKIADLFSTAQTHMEGGILTDIGISRLKYLIGHELYKHSGQLKDDPKLLEIIEAGIAHLFRTESAESADETHGAKAESAIAKAKASAEATKEGLGDDAKDGYPLKISRKAGHRTELYGVPLLFSPAAMDEALFQCVTTHLPEKKNQIQNELKLLTGRQLGRILAASVAAGFEHDGELIRFGLVLYRALGFGRFKIYAPEHSDQPYSNAIHGTRIHFSGGLAATTQGRHMIFGFIESLYKFVYHGNVEVETIDSSEPSVSIEPTGSSAESSSSSQTSGSYTNLRQNNAFLWIKVKQL